MDLRLAQLSTNSLPRGAHSSLKCIQIVRSGLPVEAFGRRIGVLSPTIFACSCLFYVQTNFYIFEYLKKIVE